MKRVFLIVLDSLGIGNAPDAKKFGDEGANTLYASLLASRRHPAWTINENAVDTLSFIKAKTNTNLSERYSELVKNHIEQISEQEQENLKQELHEGKVQSYKERIALLVEKFKHDPTKLAVISNLAAQLQEAE